jgi:hypothetical protein
MNNSKRRISLNAVGLIFGGISAVGLIAYLTKKPTEAMLNLKQAQSLFGNKYVLNSPKSIRTDEVYWIKEQMKRIKV